MNQFKKTSTVTANNVDTATGEIRSSDPADGITVAKVKGASSTSKIREMLANLNSEKD